MLEALGLGGALILLVIHLPVGFYIAEVYMLRPNAEIGVL